ncbi:MAG TPA: DUF4998 domain-containing protein [Parapedobacter sp.]|uniref:DUF4998 domain-containing protein n=1 Tax=Parapedobacter sp. TaxID=1958893 RepID=UPI002D0672C6|nr:DUF4998 domain-containing protein [Parapedobacter sp.]HWK56809.1 DUF4998 domain-containing protein [Parapedobacter sp.]
MNKSIKKVQDNVVKKIATMCAVVATFCVMSCDDMNSIHQEYYEMGEGIYTGVVDSLKALSGYERVRFDWEVNADPRVNKTVIYWNQRSDSVVVDINRTQHGRMSLSYDLENLNEGTYTFEFITRDNQGHFSMATELVVDVYGEFYIQSLRNRGVAAITKQPDETMVIEWEPIASNTVQYVTVSYEVDGSEQTVQVANDETETILTGLKTGDVIGISTTHLSENALEPLNALVREYAMPKLEREINKGNFAIVTLAGDNTSVNGDRNLAKIWDGKISNPDILHTVENAAGFNFPHHFTFDMGVPAELSRFRLWPRTDAGAFTGHSPRYFEVWATDELQRPADDNSYWTSDDWKSDWKLLGDHEIIKPVDAAGQSTEWKEGWEYIVADDAGKVRYIRLVIKNSNWQGSNCVNIGEITLWGDDL